LDRALFYRLVLAGGFGEELGGGSGVGFGAGVHSYCDQAGEGGVANFFSGLDFFGVEALVVVLGGEAHCRVIRLVRLQDDLAGAVGAAGATGDLSEQLEGSFGCAEVGEGEALIGERNADERHRGNVVAFGDHLCANQHVDFAGSQSIEHRLDAVPGRRVAIEPRDARFGETLFDRFLELLGANPDPFVLGAPARCAGHGGRPMEVTVVAPERTLPSMLGERDAARGTLGDRAARRAANAWRKPATVEEQNRLMAVVQTFTHRMMQRPRKKRVTGRPFSVATEIDDLDVGHGGAGGARG
jgi:hypothetical protein